MQKLQNGHIGNQPEKPENNSISTGRGLLALSPIAVFLSLYLSVSIVNNDFYKMPLSVAFIVASMWAIFLVKGKKMAERVEIFSSGAANANVLYMIWIFIMAGAFSALARSIGSVDATVDLTLALLPRQFLLQPLQPRGQLLQPWLLPQVPAVSLPQSRLPLQQDSLQEY